MKMVLAIVNNDDSSSVSTNLMRAGFSVTRLATTGGFLMAGNTTFLIGTDDENIETLIEIIRKHSKRRKQVSPITSSYGTETYSTVPVEVSVGGATLFIMNVERFEKL